MLKKIMILGLAFCLFGFSNSNINEKVQNVVETCFKEKNLNIHPLDVQDSVFSIISNAKMDTLGYLYISRVNTCRMGGCSSENSNFPSLENSGYENFDYYVVYDTSLKIVLINIVNYNATHGYQICSKGWLKQFYNRNGLEQISTNEVDAISGATTSVDAITQDIKSSYSKLLKELNKQN